MAIPLTLSEVPDTVPYIQYVATAGQTVYPYPFPITQDSDLVVVINGVTQATDSTYSLTGQGNDTGGNCVLNAGSAAGDIITLYRDIAIERITQFSQNSGFSSAAFNAEFNNLYLIAQQLEADIAQCLQIPNTNNPAPVTTLTQTSYANKYLTFDQYGNPQPALLTSSGTLTAAILGALLNPGPTPAELLALITPTALQYVELDPRRYGVTGNGTTNDTVALNRWIAVVNAWNTANPAGGNPLSVWSSGFVCLASPLNAITAANFTLLAPGGVILALPNQGGGNGSSLLKVTGANFVCSGLVVNGQQFSEASPTYDYLIQLTGANPTLDRVTVTYSSTYGLYLNNVAKGKFTNCEFPWNADLGSQIQTSSYLKFSNCSFDYCGYGFGNTFATNDFVGFGLAVRFQSHHITFENCRALQTGRDGMNINQGSYDIKFIGCLVWMAGDGGFTSASDQQGTGLPGDGQVCYNVEYIGCDAYNCWSSGLAIYSPTNNVRVVGGKYYNNYRLAGVLQDESTAASAGNGQNDAFVAGIFVSPGSQGVTIDADTFDDRQFCAVTGHSSGVVAATNWVAGTMANYPRVAFYNGSRVFQGYGTITAESAGSVTVATTTYNGVVIANISSGWFVTQRLQKAGVLFGTGCTGTRRGRSFGIMPGLQTYYGSKTMSTPISPSGGSNSQNVRVLDGRQSGVNLLANGTWDSSVSSGWAYSGPSGGSDTLFTTAGALLRSVGCLQLVGGTSVQNVGTGSLISSGINYVSAGAWVEYSVDVYSAAPGAATISLTWGSGNSNTAVNHPGGGWLNLIIGAYIPTGASELIPQVIAAAGNTIQFDNAVLQVISEASDEVDYNYSVSIQPT